MKRSLFFVIGLGLGGLGSSACGEITAFCMSAGAPSGVTLQVTTVQTPNGTQVVCGPAPVVVDSSRQAVPVLRDSLP